MRLYLSIHRNSLPLVKTVWPLSTSQQTWTIAQLLENVNDTFPLEAAHWGLEDYVVLLKGFECVHHHEIAGVCQDNDELVIRPLQTIEIRARTLLGRDQISHAGRHLIDGIAFGKTSLKGPVRPDVHIPPRKRRKLSPEGDQAQQNVLMLEDVDYAQEQEDNDSDGADFEEQEYDDTGTDGDNSDEEDTTTIESDEDSASSDSDDVVSSDHSSSSSSDDTDSDSAVSWDGFNRPSTKLPESEPEQRTGAYEQNDQQAVVNGDGSSDRPEAPTEHNSQVIMGIPFQGAQQTRHRNLRRRAKKRLQFLQSSGKLSSDASFADLEEYEAGETTNDVDLVQDHRNNDHPETAAQFQALLARQQKLIDAVRSGGIDINDRSLTTEDNHDHVNGEDNEPPEQMSTKGHPLAPNNATQTTINTAEDQDHERDNSIKEPILMVPSTVTARRSKLDLASSKRLLFGSLGVRVPKTDEDKLKTRTKLAAKSQTKHKPCEEREVDAARAAADYEDWQSKINLSAVECCDEGVVLSTPPFPFERGWDPQYRTSQKRKRKGGQHFQEYTEGYDKYNISSNGDALNYGDEDDAAYNNDEAWEEGALLDNTADEGPPDNDFPPLPDSVASLQHLTADDAKADDYVLYSELICTAATKWQPTFVNRTVQLKEKTVDGWQVKMALRDLPAREYDDDGNRVYAAFEMQGTDDLEDEALREMTWEELTAPRLLLRVSSMDHTKQATC